MHVSPHLCFNGQCRAAFMTYHQIFGGTLKTMLTYGESPMAQQVDSRWHDHILHATLHSEDIELNGTDLLSTDDTKPQGFFVTLTVEDPARAHQMFSKLAEGGTIGLPFQATFWSRGFGVVVDKFGMPWEVTSVERNAPAFG
jgi:PhnB protein